MRSVPVAMTWEIVSRGRWGLAAATLGAIALPGIILTALRLEGPLDPHEPAMLAMHLIVMHINVLMFGAAVFDAQGRVSQLYAYPVRTTALVAWRMLPAMAIVGLQAIVSIAVLNAMFDLGWPLWGPALFMAVAVAAVEAAWWLAEKSVAWLIVAAILVAAMCSLWLRSRYEPIFYEPTRLWQQLTPAEVFTMLATAAAAYGIAVVAVARNRRGEPPFSLGIIDWLAATFSLATINAVRMGTPAQAQAWFLWRRKGWIMPAIVAFCVATGTMIWSFTSREPEDLFLGLLAGGGMVWLVGFVGGPVMGNAGPTDSDFVMGHFVATRPMSDAEMARAVLRTAAGSVLLAWLIWAASLLMVCLFLVAAGATYALELPDDLSWWYFPATLFGTWVVVGTLLSIFLAGRTRLAGKVLCALAAAFIALMLLSKWWLSPEAQYLLWSALTALVGGALLLTTAGAYITARRRMLIRPRTVWPVAIVWSAATALIMLQWPLKEEPSSLAYLLAAGILALAVAPIAAAPLAVGWNRHRK